MKIWGCPIASIWNWKAFKNKMGGGLYIKEYFLWPVLVKNVFYFFLENKAKKNLIETLVRKGYDSDPVKAWKDLQGRSKVGTLQITWIPGTFDQINIVTGRDDFFFSCLTDFSYFSRIKIFWKLKDKVRTVKKGPFEKGCRWFQLFYLLIRIIPVLGTFEKIN